LALRIFDCMKRNTYCPRSRNVSPDPGELVAALPYLVGFPPKDSIVAAFLDSDGNLTLTARLDWDVVSANPANVAASFGQFARQSMTLSVVLVAVGPTHRPEAQESELAELVRRIEEAKGGALAVLWAVHTQSGRWWADECHKSCGPRSHQVPRVEDSVLAGDLEEEGRIPRKDRDQIVSEFETAPTEAVNLVAERVAELELVDSRLLSCASLRLSLVDRVELLLFADTVMGYEDLAAIAVCCQDTRMRDTLLWRFAQYAEADPKMWINRWPRIHMALAYAPPTHVAAVAAVAGLFAWQKGDGIRSETALDRAIKSNPDHGLANLVRTAVRAGLPPQKWRVAIGGLSEEDVARGDGQIPASGRVSEDRDTSGTGEDVQAA
jgi:hypothetical protein